MTKARSNAVANAAKGDLTVGNGTNLSGILAVGSNGDTLVADSSTATGLSWQGNYAAGKNKLINADFRINQRNFSSVTTNATYGFDRWILSYSGDGTTTYTPQTFTAGAAPVAGYEAINFARIVTAGQTSATVRTQLAQRVEDVRTFAGQTVTLSFWAKAATGTPKVGGTFLQNFGTGGSPSGSVFGTGQVVTISTSWARYSFTFALPSLSGKTFGTDLNSSYIGFFLGTSAGTDPSVAWAGPIGIQSATIDFWGVQLEAGSTATAFQTATGTIQGELAACQRYYVRFNASASGPYAVFAPSGITEGTTIAVCYTPLPVELRTYPSAVEYGGSLILNSTGAAQAVTAVTLQDRTNTKILSASYVVASGMTTAQYSFVRADNSSTAYLGVSAEL